VIDCSWAHFDEVKVKSLKQNERLLPLCKAANPVNYGKDIKLNCAEALAGALFLSGYAEDAERLMDEFKYGPAFFAINEFHFQKYS
jgi:pre-rRNA-processing protein TSR3